MKRRDRVIRKSTDGQRRRAGTHARGRVSERTLLRSRSRGATPLALLALALCGLALPRPAASFNYVADANGTFWGIQDVDPPRVDTGSVRATQVGAGQSPAFSTSINGFGGIKVLVEKDPAPRFNGEMMRGFGLVFDGVDRFTTTQSVDLGGVVISRAVYVNRSANWTRWLDTFTNATDAPLTIEVAFGGQSGIGNSGGNSSTLVNTSSGDAAGHRRRRLGRGRDAALGHDAGRRAAGGGDRHADDRRRARSTAR